MAMTLHESDNVRISENFNASDSDVTISSSDGVLFKVHKETLTTHSEVFPDGTFSTNNEIVTLSERSSTLDMLFHYIYRKPQPDITELSFEELSMLAEAAEKYHVYSAMEVCRILMRGTLPKNAISILAYAVRHGYAKIYVEAAPLTLRLEPKEVFEHLGHVFFVHWVLYREEWLKALGDARDPPSPGAPVYHYGPLSRKECVLWKTFQPAVTNAIGNDLSALRRIPDIFAKASESAGLGSTSGTNWQCETCCKAADAWSARIINTVSALPQFSLTL